jgi:tripartite-type tricarboxylate transporter receptor subunit TctC
MAINSGLLLSQIARREGIEFDLARVGWLGKAGAEARLVLMQEKTGIRSIDDLQADARTRIFVTSGFGSASFIQTRLFADAFKVNMKVLPGFGGNEAEAALMKGEIDGILTSESNGPSVIASGTARAILRFGDAMIEQFRQLPDGMTVAKTADQKLVAEKITAMNNLGRPTLTAPDTSPEILEMLRNAYAQALADPDLLAEAARQGLPIDFQNGSVVEAGVRSFLHQGEAFAAMVAKTLVKE